MRATYFLSFNCILFSALFPLLVTGQMRDTSSFVRCGTDEFMRELYEQNPALLERANRMDRLWENWEAPAAKTSDEILYRIPVVFHVIHDFGPENIPASQIRSQIEVLNEDFQKLAGTPGDGPGANPQIEFYLAKIDPYGECTNGITRHFSPLTYNAPGASSLAPIEYWPSTNYMNVYLVRSTLGGFLGSAFVPEAGLNLTWPDAIIMLAKNTGRTGAVDPPYNGGRTLTHEAGHWLGLHHPFHQGLGETVCSGSRPENCRTAGDKVCDTPAEREPDFGCYESENSCVDYPADRQDLPGLYLNYYDDGCMDRFTEGQVLRMHFTLEEIRKQIWSEDNLIRTGYYGCETSSRNNMHADGLPDLQLYPNPAQDKLTVSFSGARNSVWRAEVFAADGKKAAVYQLTPENGNVAREVNVSQLAAGVYTLVVSKIGGPATAVRRFAIY